MPQLSPELRLRPATKKPLRQAVVLIHGIGEQRPMSTLRGFVAAILCHEPSPRVYSKPDQMSKSFELRRLVAAESRSRPATDFFEYYWAHHMDKNALKDLWHWLRDILFRSPYAVPSKLRLIWTLSWILILASCILFVRSRLNNADTGRGTSSLASLLIGGTFVVLQGFAISYLGDAARYLSPHPNNIAVRQKIRSEGLALLTRLHRCGKYDRIVLVGHSLGSVIGYDILTHLWISYHTSLSKVDKPKQRGLDHLQKVGRKLSQASSPSQIAEFQQAQLDLWRECRQYRCPWLVTDFVTIGSPLTHAVLLLAHDAKDFEARRRQREFPSCPPVEDDKSYAYCFRYKFDGQPRSMRVLHHAAPFAVTRWYNLYVPTKLGLLGDLVGGPLRPVFGPGILDVPVLDGWKRFFPLLSHTRYWTQSIRESSDQTSPLSALCDVLALGSRSWLTPPVTRLSPLPCIAANIATASPGDQEDNSIEHSRIEGDPPSNI
jgi:hypothetical protein